MEGIFKNIKNDHDNVKKLIKKIREEKKTEKIKEHFDLFKKEMWAHNRVEETVFYDKLLEKSKSMSDSLEAKTEHSVIGLLLDDLNIMSIEDSTWKVKFKVCSELIEHHVKEEEDDIFKKAQKIIKTQEANEMGEEFLNKKKMFLAIFM